MIDSVRLTAHAGRGGDGAVSFRREKFVPRGGPDGGDGGRGGDVTLVASTGMTTLRVFQRRRVLRAGSGGPGGPNRRKGRNGASLVVEVPAGTLVYAVRDGEIGFVGDLVAPGARLRVARGGRGGWGNARFATATRRVPRFAERGLDGDEVALQLELKLLADVGIVGVPNAGKSTLLRAVSAARPKVGDYPFTTLEPSLGVVECGDRRLVFADIPGLIEGAHRGVGLGLDFLRHIERTRVVIHLLDGTSPDVVRDMEMINREMAAHAGGVMEAKPQIVAINKVDRAEVRAALQSLRERLTKAGVVAPLEVSAQTGAGVADLVARAFAEAEAVQVPHVEEPPVLRPPSRQPVEVSCEDGVYVVRHRRAEVMVRMLDVRNDEARGELLQRLRRIGVVKALEQAGIQRGDRVRVGSSEWEWE